MQFDRTKLFKEFAASQLATRRDQIWGVEVIKINGTDMFVLVVIDLHTRRPLSAALTSAIADDIAATLAKVGVRSGYPE